MNIIRKIDIAKEYNVSSGTVTRWVEMAGQSKNNLQLTTIKNKPQVIDTPNNRAELNKLKLEGNKFKSHIHSVTVQPTKEFYEIFAEDQIIEIINSLRTKKYIPIKYTYIEGGADYWDQSYNQGKTDKTITSIPITKSLLRELFDYIIYKTSDYDKINIIDVGPGNSELVREFIESLIEVKKLNKYIALDISDQMLNLSETNIKELFGGSYFEKYTCDIEKNDFADLLLLSKQKGTVNVVLFLGSTIGNLEDRSHTLQNFRKSLDNEDILVISNHIANDAYRLKHANLKNYSRLSTWILSALGIEFHEEDLITYYDDKIAARVLALRLDKNYKLELKVRDKKVIIELEKGEKILIYYHHPSTIEEMLDELKRAKLQLIKLTTQKNLSHLLVVAQAATS